MPSAARSNGFSRAMSLALEQDAAARDRPMACNGAQQRRLADAVAAEHAGDLADGRQSTDTPRRACAAP